MHSRSHSRLFTDLGLETRSLMGLHVLATHQLNGLSLMNVVGKAKNHLV